MMAGHGQGACLYAPVRLRIIQTKTIRRYILVLINNGECVLKEQMQSHCGLTMASLCIYVG